MSPPQVNSLLQNLRGEHFRHARNAQGKPASSASLSSHAHNRPTLPISLIYPSPAPETSPPRVPGPRPPRSWRPPAPSSPAQVQGDPDVVADTPAWRERALSLLFSAASPARPIYPDPSPIPQLTLLCLQLVRSACPGPDLARIVPCIPPHLRRALARYAAVHAPLSQTELDALCEGAAHIDTELIVVGSRRALRKRRSAAQVPESRRTPSTHQRHHRWYGDDDDDDAQDFPAEHVRYRVNNLGPADPAEPSEWDADDAAQTHESETALRSLAVLSSPLSAAAMLALPPTITHLALVHLPHPIPVHRLPSVCPLLVLLDLSYNAWLAGGGRSVLEEVGWGGLRRLEVLGLRGCLVTPALLLELNRGRWGDVRVVQ